MQFTLKPWDHSSASQVNTFRRCRRKWWFEKRAGIRLPPSEAQLRGTRVHAILEHYLLTGEKPDATTLEGQIAAAGLHLLPEPPIPKDQVERWIELGDGVVPIVGFVDLLEERDGLPYVTDHKTTSAWRWRKVPEQLANDSQAVIYASWLARQVGAPRVGFRHVYYRTKSPAACEVGVVFEAEDLEAKLGRIYSTLDHQSRAARATTPDAVEGNPSACGDYGGCPFRLQCAKIGDIGTMSGALKGLLKGASKNKTEGPSQKGLSLAERLAKRKRAVEPAKPGKAAGDAAKRREEEVKVAQERTKTPAYFFIYGEGASDGLKSVKGAQLSLEKTLRGGPSLKDARAAVEAFNAKSPQVKASISEATDQGHQVTYRAGSVPAGPSLRDAKDAVESRADKIRRELVEEYGHAAEDLEGKPIAELVGILHEARTAKDPINPHDGHPKDDPGPSPAEQKAARKAAKDQAKSAVAPRLPEALKDGGGELVTKAKKDQLLSYVAWRTGVSLELAKLAAKGEKMGVTVIRELVGKSISLEGLEGEDPLEPLSFVAALLGEDAWQALRAAQGASTEEPAGEEDEETTEEPAGEEDEETTEDSAGEEDEETTEEPPVGGLVIPGFLLLLDAAPMLGSEHLDAVTVEEAFGSEIQAVCVTLGVDYYAAPDFRKGQRALAERVAGTIDKDPSIFHGLAFKVSSRASYYPEVVEVLAQRATVTIRGSGA